MLAFIAGVVIGGVLVYKFKPQVDNAVQFVKGVVK